MASAAFQLLVRHAFWLRRMTQYIKVFMIIIKIVGVYQIHPTIESIVRASEYHQYSWLVNKHGQLADDIFWDNFQNLSLVELKVQGKATNEKFNQ